MLSYRDILEEVRLIVAEVLVLELDEVAPGSRFFHDLGGESIDMLEMSFLCEKRLNAKIPVRNMFGNDVLDTDDEGRLTPQALTMLRDRYPYLSYAKIEDDPKVSRLQELITVDAIARIVEAVLSNPDEQMNGTMQPVT